MVEIYGLHDPDTGELRYVGKANNAAQRLKSHITNCHRVHTPVTSWIAALLKAGKLPVMKVMEVVAKDEWEAAERRLIAQHRLTAKLLNVADGGAVPHQTRDQRRNAARAANESMSKRSKAWKQFQAAKRDMGRLLASYMKGGHFAQAYALRFRMKLRAADKPHYYGSWATL